VRFDEKTDTGSRATVNGSTAIESLTQAFMSLHLNATLQGLSSKLLNYANVTILPTTGLANNFAASVVSIQNPFTAPLRITNIQSNITAHGFYLGNINVDTDFSSLGLVGTVSPILNFNLNLYPPDIFALLRALVVATGTLDPAPLDGIVSLGNIRYSSPIGSTNLPHVVKRHASPEHRLISRRSSFGQDFSDVSSFELHSLSKRGLYTGCVLSLLPLPRFLGC